MLHCSCVQHNIIYVVFTVTKTAQRRMKQKNKIMSWFWLQRDAQFFFVFQQYMLLLHGTSHSTTLKFHFLFCYELCCFYLCLCDVFSLALSRQQFHREIFFNSNISGFFHAAHQVLCKLQRGNIKCFVQKNSITYHMHIYIYIHRHRDTYTKHQLRNWETELNHIVNEYREFFSLLS